jgi:hypothetical protein
LKQVTESISGDLKAFKDSQIEFNGGAKGQIDAIGSSVKEL